VCAVTGFAWASPLELTSSGGRRAHGAARSWPLEERWRVYLAISRRPNGALVAVFRNPEQNDLGKWFRFSVTRAGDSLRFDLPASGEDQPATQLAATYDSVRRVDRAGVARAGPRCCALRRRTARARRGSFPRLPRAARYGYRQPGQIGDGWHTAPREGRRFDEAALARLVQQIADTDPLNPRHRSCIRCSSPVTADSCSRSISRVTIGAACTTRARREDVCIGDGGGDRARSGDAGEGRRHARGFADAHERARVPTITIRSRPVRKCGMRTQTAQPGLVAIHPRSAAGVSAGDALRLLLGGDDLAGYALHRASANVDPRALRSHVARPLGFGRYYWDLMPTLEGYLGGGVQMLPRDFAQARRDVPEMAVCGTAGVSSPRSGSRDRLSIRWRRAWAPTATRGTSAR